MATEAKTLINADIDPEPKDGRVDFVSPKSRLSRLNFFDGRYLRAENLTREQSYVSALIRLANQAGGSGVVYGFDVSLTGPDAQVSTTDLKLGRGLAINAVGQVLYLEEDVSVGLEKFLASVVDNGPTGGALRVYRLSVSLAETLDDYEEVFGLTSVDACSPREKNAYRIEGVTLRAERLDIANDLGSKDYSTELNAILEAARLRSRLASLQFTKEDEELYGLNASTATSPLSDVDGPAGRAGARFRQGAAPPENNDVPVAMLAVRESRVLFLDPWILRRDRITPPGQRALGGIFGVRPLESYLAQIMQFQCQLYDVSESANQKAQKTSQLPTDADLLQRIISTLNRLDPGNAVVQADLMAQLSDLLALQGFSALPGSGDPLLSRGFTDLPPAGFLPVQTNQPVQEQVRRLLPDSDVQLRISTVPLGAIPRALMKAQHNQRISLASSIVAQPGAAAAPAGTQKSVPTVEILIPSSPDGTPKHWVLFCQGFRDDLDAYEEKDVTPQRGTYNCYWVYRTPLTGNTRYLYTQEDIASLRLVSHLAGKVYLRKTESSLFEDYFKLDRAWGCAPRKLYLTFGPEALQAEGTTRSKETKLIDSRLAPSQPVVGDSTSTKHFVQPNDSGDSHLFELFLFTPYVVRIQAITDTGHRIAIRPDWFELASEMSGRDGHTQDMLGQMPTSLDVLKGDPGHGVIGVHEQVQQRYPDAKLASLEIITPIDVERSPLSDNDPIKRDIELRDQVIGSGLLNRPNLDIGPNFPPENGTRKATPSEELDFLKNGIRADALLRLTYKTTA